MGFQDMCTKIGLNFIVSMQAMKIPVTAAETNQALLYIAYAKYMQTLTMTISIYTVDQFLYVVKLK